MVCSSIPSHFRMHITEFRVSLHSDGGREDGTEGEAPALLHLLLEVCRVRTLHIQRNYGMSRHTIDPLKICVHSVHTSKSRFGSPGASPSVPSCLPPSLCNETEAKLEANRLCGMMEHITAHLSIYCRGGRACSN